MRTTITLEDTIYDDIKEISYTKNIPLKAAINLVLAKGLQFLEKEPDIPEFSQKSYSLGEPYSEYDLIKALESAGNLEAAEIKRKLELRK
jgi:hypothetical protein